MSQNNFGFNSDDFLSGQHDHLFQTVNAFSGGSYNKYTPINPRALSFRQYDEIERSSSIMPHIYSIYQANIGANGRRVVIAQNDQNTPATQKLKERTQKRVYNFLYTKKNWADLEDKIINVTAKEGSCIIMPDANDELAVWSLRRFNVYHDDVTNTTRYAFKNGNDTEIKEMSNLVDRIDLYHFKDPVFKHWIVPPSRLDCAFNYILLQNNGLRSNNFIFSNAFIGTTLLGFNSDAASSGGQLASDMVDGKKVPDKQGKSIIQRMVDKINDTFSGVQKSFRVGYAYGLDKVFELGKSNRDIQFLELLVKSKTEILSSYSLTMSDVGDGDKGLTYSNAATFSYAVYGKVGHAFEDQFDELCNEYFLPFYGITTTESFYIDYLPPSNPDRLALEEQSRKHFETNLVTVNEHREVCGLEPTEGGDVFLKDWAAPTVETLPNPNSDTIEVEAKTKPKEQLNNSSGFFTKVAFALPSPTDKALLSELYLGNSKKKGFLNKWTEAITKQITTYVKELEKTDNIDLETYTVKLPKIETFYSFPSLKKDLLAFAGLALDEVKKDKRTNFAFQRDYFDGVYPQAVIDQIDKFTEAVLKGLPDMFDSVDVETNAQIQNIIKANINSGAVQIAQIIAEALPRIGVNRAKLIAETAVAEAVEKTRERMYLIEFPEGTKEWLTTLQDVCPLCIGNERQGRIKITDLFSSGVSAPSAHGRCRCTAIYNPAD